MQFLRKIGDMLEVDDGQESSTPADATPLQTLEEMLHLPEEDAEKEARACAELLQNAAKASEALAQQLPEALKRARKAEMEVQRLKEALAESEAKMAALQAQQLRLADGLLGEIRQRDAELALLRVAAAAGGYTPGEEDATKTQEQEVVTLNEGTVDFNRSAASKQVASSSTSELSTGDEVISLNGLSARNMTWEEFDAALANRPVVLTVQRERRSGGIAAKMRSLSVWTRDKAKAAARELEQAMAEMQEDPLASNMENEEPPALEASKATDEAADVDPEDAEARNRPFYDLVRGSMAEPAAAFVAAGDANATEAFERWLRQFHSERDDEWFANNRTRVYNAFRPHWDEVVQSAKDRAS
ncbi:unnamed protein product [Cladocopium goreaui]|uniref:PDZ domain-containing protein n=1 Tax=Cladocopium goreaui TaxID=2562237 RepID=A0A9P1BP18_9DINO|nr:unnamed protein product [Cladocopium goreaui]